MPEPTCKAIANSWDRLFLQPIESHLAWDFFYLGAQPQTRFLKEKEVGKLDIGVGCMMIVDIKAVEQATAAQRKEWSFDRFLSLFPNKTLPKYQWPRFTWRQSGQKAIRTTFPFALWAGEFNFASSTPSIDVSTWNKRKWITFEELEEIPNVGPNIRGLGFTTSVRTKLLQSEDDQDAKLWWEEWKKRNPDKPYPPGWETTPWPCGGVDVYQSRPNIQWDYVEGAPDQQP